MPTPTSTPARPTETAQALDWIVPGVDGDAQAVAWNDAYTAWLNAKRRHGGSSHTVAAYATDFADFFRHALKAPWMVSSVDADAWRTYLEHERGLKSATINRKIAALSSFYTFVADKYTFVGHDHVERSIYIDKYGNPRPNPFRKLDRNKVRPYGTSRPLAAGAVRKALERINRNTKLGARDHALITAYVYTGRRSTEIANLRWGDIEHNPRTARTYYTWAGKGKQRTDEMPPPVYHAIIHFLTLTGRLETVRPLDYIFRPVFADRTRRLPHMRDVDLPDNRPITRGMINRIVKRRFAAVGVDPAQVHTHTLRHTAAHLRYRDGEGQDVKSLSEFLNHSDLAVTQIYLSTAHQPIDIGWGDVEQLLSA